jgi:hypothetical protein
MNTKKSKIETQKQQLDIPVVRNQREQLIDLIKKAQTPKGNCVVDWLMKEYENSKIN